ncbi:hypothetical protein [Qipengyuania sp. ASV99]|uniref:hypothetical protein n=1 Tax=Qipengyuania sp. ASV99 TaxID=3399681 RepID=UPI003A4C61AB
MTSFGYLIKQLALYLILLWLTIIAVTYFKDGAFSWEAAKSGLIGVTLASPILALMDLRRWKNHPK